MKNFESEKSDVVSVILEDRDLLDTFADTLELPKNPASSIRFLQKIRCYIWSVLKKMLKTLSIKTQILAVLAEYHSNHEDKKIQAILTKDKT